MVYEMECMWAVGVYTHADFVRIPNTFRSPGAVETNSNDYLFFPLQCETN